MRSGAKLAAGTLGTCLLAWAGGGHSVLLAAAAGVAGALTVRAAVAEMHGRAAAPEDRPPGSLLGDYEPDYPGRYRRHADSALHRGREVVPGPTLEDPDRGRIASLPILDSSDPSAP